MVATEGVAIARASAKAKSTPAPTHSMTVNSATGRLQTREPGKVVRQHETGHSRENPAYPFENVSSVQHKVFAAVEWQRDLSADCRREHN